MQCGFSLHSCIQCQLLKAALFMNIMRKPIFRSFFLCEKDGSCDQFLGLLFRSIIPGRVYDQIANRESPGKITWREAQSDLGLQCSQRPEYPFYHDQAYIMFLVV